MPPIRFLHAAGIDPDAVLPRLPASCRTQFDAAPLTAIERLVTQAIELQVDFLLVTPAVGPDGAAEEPGFRSAIAVRREFARLTPHAIPAVLAVGHANSAWSRLAGRDSTLTVMEPGESVPIPDRDGRSRTSLRCLGSLSEAERPASMTRRESELDLVVAPRLAVEHLKSIRSSPHRYVGCGVGLRRSMPLSAGLAHSPGAVQSLAHADCGPHGATLVTIEEGSEVQTEFVPIASIRYESIAIRTKPGEPLEDLAIRMADRLDEQRSEAGEQAWDVRWAIEAGEELFETLSDPVQRTTLGGLLPDSVGGVPVAHRLNVSPHPLWPALDEPFAAEFAAALVEQEGAWSDPATRLALIGVTSETKHRSRFERLLAATEMSAAMNQARRLGIQIVTAAKERDDG
ncbi:MAG: hypothetical protein WBC44_14060 [Planctomycetaceae bacterium]